MSAIERVDEARRSPWRWLGYLGAAALILILTAVLTGSVAPAALALSNETVWYAIRASGVIAYLFLAASTIWGLLLTTKAAKAWLPAAVALDLHNYLSWVAIGLTALHAVLLLFSDFFTYRVVDLLIPFIGPFEPLWVGLGVIGLYLMVATSLSFSFIRQLGHKSFRQIHYLTYAAFLLALLHSVVAGTDTVAMTGVYLVSGLGVALLTVYRLMAVRA